MNCDECGENTFFVGMDPITKKELCKSCYDKILILSSQMEEKLKIKPKTL